jgi:hypothetical protein
MTVNGGRGHKILLVVGGVGGGKCDFQAPSRSRSSLAGYEEILFLWHSGLLSSERHYLGTS